jgi:hypothetical protein
MNAETLVLDFQARDAFGRGWEAPAPYRATMSNWGGQMFE